ncbi:MAG: hypothetical protein R3Y53_06890 [Bacillota bacterium]
MNKKFVHFFSVGLFLFYMASMTISNLPIWKDTFATVKRNNTENEVVNYQQLFLDFDSEFAKNMENKNEYITLSGGFARFLGKTHFNNRFRLGNQLYQPRELDLETIQSSVENMTALQESLEALEIPLLYVQAPAIISPSGEELLPGMNNNENESIDLLIEGLADTNVHILDLRGNMIEEGRNFQDAYFDSDHHWTIETLFWASQHVLEEMSMLLDFELKEEYLGLEHWKQTVYPDAFFGSSGQRVGTLFTGIEDFTLIEPDFETDFTSFPYGEEHRTRGDFSVIINKSYLNSTTLDDYMETYCFGVYDAGNDSVINNLAYNDKVILLLRDSFGMSLSKFILPHIHSLYSVDLRHQPSEDLFDLIAEVDPDLVLIQYAPYSQTASGQKYEMQPIEVDSLKIP